MITVDVPEFNISSGAFFRSCAAATRPIEKRERLVAATDAVELAVSDYVEHARSQQLHRIAPVTDVFSAARRNDFGSLYDSFLVNRDGVGRVHYDRILAAPAQGICPYCATRKVETVDHFLPKTDFPQFGIAFENLVGCCTDCNRAKFSGHASSLNELLFHPYYEAFPDEEWLTASIVHEHPVTAAFSIIDSASEFERISNQFSNLELGEIYAVRAGAEISTMSFLFENLLEGAGNDGLHEFLSNCAESAARQPFEPWKSALYRGLADDAWFCNGGFTDG